MSILSTPLLFAWGGVCAHIGRCLFTAEFQNLKFRVRGDEAVKSL